MVAVIKNCAVILAGQRHVFTILLSALRGAERASHPCRFIEVKLINEISVHFILPSELRLNERFFLGDSSLMPVALEPPLVSAIL
jgi:hypothetical protein